MEGKILKAIEATTLRMLISKANNLTITKEEIVSINKLDELFVLLYYR